MIVDGHEIRLVHYRYFYLFTSVPMEEKQEGGHRSGHTKLKTYEDKRDVDTDGVSHDWSSVSCFGTTQWTLSPSKTDRPTFCPVVSTKTRNEPSLITYGDTYGDIGGPIGWNEIKRSVKESVSHTNPLHEWTSLRRQSRDGVDRR